MIKIGSAEIDTNIFLAPLAGCSDLAFRSICREYGARFCFFEMLDANCVINERVRTLDIINTNEKDLPIAAQLLGSDPHLMLNAAEKLLSMVRISFLDLNFACPARKVIRKKAGAYMIDNKTAISKILKKMSSSLHLPITVKIRCGYLKRDIEHITDVAKICQDSGAKAIFIHGRTSSEGYGGEVDYASIKAVKESVEIPVFGSGNIFTPVLAKKMFDDTGCDGILVARGAIGNPWIFREIETYIEKGKEMTPPTLAKKKTALKKHIAYIEKYKKIRPASKLGVMRKVAIWYMRDFPEAKKVRGQIGRTRSYAELSELIRHIKTCGN